MERQCFQIHNVTSGFVNQDIPLDVWGQILSFFAQAKHSVSKSFACLRSADSSC